jgi:hypothetical protein
MFYAQESSSGDGWLSEMSTSLLSPGWWMSVVVAGLLVNLASAYLKPIVDHMLERVSSAARQRSATRVAAHRLLVARLGASPEVRIRADIERGMRMVLAAIQFMGSVVFSGLGGYWLGYSLLQDAIKWRDTRVLSVAHLLLSAVMFTAFLFCAVELFSSLNRFRALGAALREVDVTPPVTTAGDATAPSVNSLDVQ